VTGPKRFLQVGKHSFDVDAVGNAGLIHGELATSDAKRGGRHERHRQASDFCRSDYGNSGYAFDGIDWKPPQGGVPFPCLHDEADAMHSLLVSRADKLVGCTEGCEFEVELKMIADTFSAYEAKRWPDGVVRGGKG
jgi:hypothetical protein